MRVLLVEDDQQVVSYLQKALREVGAVFDHAGDGREGLLMAAGEDYDVLIIDRMLPQLDGLTIVRTLRASGNRTPVLILSALGDMDRQTDETIEAEIRGLAEQYRRRGLNGLSRIVAERVSRDPNGASVYLLTDKDYSPIIGNLSRWPDAPIADDGWTRFRLLDWGSDKSKEHEARARTFLLRGGLHLLVGRDVRELEATRRLILNALSWGLAITAALALGIGALMSSRVTRRIEAINQTGREIMEGDLSRRVARDGSGDDFDQLAANLNRMLERIEGLMAAVRQVSDNIAHDLRTPFTRLRTRLELARGDDAHQTREAARRRSRTPTSCSAPSTPCCASPASNPAAAAAPSSSWIWFAWRKTSWSSTSLWPQTRRNS